MNSNFKSRTIEALLEKRKLFGGTDGKFAAQYGIHASAFSRLKKGEIPDHLLPESKWVEIARELGVDPSGKRRRAARTQVFEAISSDIQFCREHSKSLIFVDEPEIGKTFTAKHLANTIPNCFYIDCSQAKTKSLFIRAFARAIGLDQTGTFADMKSNIKYYLATLEKPVVILDEAGDLSYGAFLDIKEYWNATDGACGWYMMGADGLRTVMESGISRRKVGFRELFSRFSSNYMSIVPHDRAQRQEFYSQLITDVAEANVADQSIIPSIVKKCLTSSKDGTIGGLRRLESLLILHGHAA